MNGEREKHIVALALEAGLVTRDQVEACGQLRRQATDASPPSILALLLLHGHLTRQQVVDLAARLPRPEAEAKAPAAPPPAGQSAQQGGEAAAPPETGPSAEPLPDVARCEMVAGLGGGTVAATCVIRDPATGRRYVLKAFYPSISRKTGFAERARHEAAQAVQIQHPSVVRVLGTGMRLNDIYVLTEYVEGASLAQLLAARGKLEAHEILAIAVGCAQALEQGERVGLRHGAVSPTNILVAQDGTVKLDDLGVAKPRAVDLSILKTGEGIRAPYYLSPEHVAGDPLDARSDLFSLGAVLYHGLTGRQPFGGDTTAEVTTAIRSGHYRPVTTANPEASRGFAAVVTKLLEPEPAQRYQSIRELLADLEAIQGGRVPAAQRAAIARKQAEAADDVVAVSVPQETPPPSRRRLWPWAAAAAVVLGIVALIAALGGGEAPDETAVRRQRQAELRDIREGSTDDRTEALEDFAKAHKGTEEGEEARCELAYEKLEAALREAHDFAALNAGNHPAVAKCFAKLADQCEYAVVGETREQRVREIRAEALLLETLAFVRQYPRRDRQIAKMCSVVLKAYEESADPEKGARAKERVLGERADVVLKEAEAFAEAHKNDPARRKEILERFRDIAQAYKTTAAGGRAQRRLEDAEAKERNETQRQFTEARDKARQFVQKKLFGEALRVYDALLAAKPPEDVRQLILTEKSAVQTQADDEFKAIHAQAQDQARAGYYAKAVALYRQVDETFGLKSLVDQARGEIAIIEPQLQSASRRRRRAIGAAKYDHFLILIEPAIKLACTWSFQQADRQAEKARPQLRAAETETFLDDFRRDLKQMRKLKLDAIARINDKKAPPVLARDFSLGKFRGRLDKLWLQAPALRADDVHVVFRYGQIEVRRPWSDFPRGELYQLAKLSCDPRDPESHVTLGLYCLYADLLGPARRELGAARATGRDVAKLLARLEAAQGAVSAPSVDKTKAEEASQLLIDARRFLAERAWDRALYRFALLRIRHDGGDYDLTPNLKEINERIAECKPHVDRMQMQADLALGRAVPLIRRDDLGDWEQHFGKWAMVGGVLHGQVAQDHDAECLFSLQHPPSYELRAEVRVLAGTGAILRLAGKGRPNVGFWVHAADPKLVGLLHAYPGDEKPAERQPRPFTFTPKTWAKVRAVVTPAYVAVTIGRKYKVTMPNKLPPQKGNVHTYGFVVNAKSTAELRNLTVRILQEQ